MAPTQAPDSAPPPSWDPLPLEVLSESLAGTPNLFAHIIDTFLAHSNQTLARMRTAAAAGNFSELVNEAHSLKGSAGTLGAVRLASLCEQLEVTSRARGTDSSRVETSISSIDDELTEVSEFLVAWLAEREA